MRKLGIIGIALLLAAGCHEATAAASSTLTPPPSTPAPFATPPVLAGTPDIATLVARVRPAVVNITTTHAVKLAQGPMQLPFGFDFRGPNGGSGGPQLMPRERTLEQKALGTGVLIDAAGHVLTNAHVIDGADVVRVKLSDDREFDAKVKGRDARMDLAVLELQNAKNLPAPASLGASGALRVGDYVVAIGNPFGLGNTVTMGIVSAKGRAIGAGPYDDFIQTDASINPGNSGGPLFDLHGQVVGINTAINPAGKGIGFAIPIDSAKDVIPQLLAKGHVDRGRLGVEVQPLDDALARALGLDRAHGALVAMVQDNSPAKAAGLREGDLIVAVDRSAIDREQDLPREVARHAPGSHITVHVLRNGKPQTFDVTLAALGDSDGASAPPAPATQGSGSQSLGITTSQADNGVLVERVEPGGPADGQLAAGDVILEADHAAVRTPADLAAKAKLATRARPLLLKVQRDDATRFVALAPR
jgi:serine protease Do